MRVELSEEEMRIAAVIGTLRQSDNWKTPHWGVLASSEEFAYDNHVISAMTEYSVSKMFNLHWSLEERYGHDVGGVIEVRYRRKGVGPDLGIRDRDNNNRPYLLVHAEPPVFECVGWIFGNDGWKIGALNHKTGLHFVRGSVPPLRPVFELPSVIKPHRPG